MVALIAYLFGGTMPVDKVLCEENEVKLLIMVEGDGFSAGGD